jgi:hypothetical protein
MCKLAECFLQWFRSILGVFIFSDVASQHASVGEAELAVGTCPIRMSFERTEIFS